MQSFSFLKKLRPHLPLRTDPVQRVQFIAWTGMLIVPEGGEERSPLDEGYALGKNGQ